MQCPEIHNTQTTYIKQFTATIKHTTFSFYIMYDTESYKQYLHNT